ncbi:MAG: NADH:flavin oxidoreductase [Myxococcales bacterium]|nr:NADH:flavin oxidoreductase [Myxococcales bacterium]
MPKLTDPVSFRCGLVSKNRVALAALTNQQSEEDGTLSRDEESWLLRRAAGGFGIVTTCASHVSASGKGFDGQLGIYADGQLPRLTELASGIRERGALGLVQLYHGGVRSPSRLTGTQPLSASSFQEAREGFEVPRAATLQEISGIIEDFVGAGVRAKRAGFAGVELHGAHGYLLSQFLSREMNTRTDEWGGPIESRARILREITRRLRAAVGEGFAIGVRLSPEDYGFARGLDLDETVAVAAMLAEDGVDFVHLSLWDFRSRSKKRPEEHALPLFRAAVPRSVPLVAAGKIWTSEDAEEVLALGADVVALGRAAILNPDWPIEHTREGWQPRRGPLTPAEYAELAVSPRFATYLKRFPNMVAQD